MIKGLIGIIIFFTLIVILTKYYYKRIDKGIDSINRYANKGEYPPTYQELSEKDKAREEQASRIQSYIDRQRRKDKQKRPSN